MFKIDGVRQINYSWLLTVLNGIYLHSSSEWFAYGDPNYWTNYAWHFFKIMGCIHCSWFATVNPWDIVKHCGDCVRQHCNYEHWDHSHWNRIFIQFKLANVTRLVSCLIIGKKVIEFWKNIDVSICILKRLKILLEID